jgi:L-fuculose-phosphate aldolase
MTIPEVELRSAVLAVAQAMNALCNNRGRAGNVSARLRRADSDGFLVTPSGMDYASLSAHDLVALHADGTPRDADARKPSSEWRLHAAVYRARPDAAGIACLGRAIPPFHYMVAVAGGDDIRCAPYARFGTQWLADAAVAALAGRNACLLAQHGMIAVGPSVAEALRIADEVETLAEMYWRVLEVGEPVLLSPAEMAEVNAQFRGYGQQPR